MYIRQNSAYVLLKKDLNGSVSEAFLNLIILYNAERDRVLRVIVRSAEYLPCRDYSCTNKSDLLTDNINKRKIEKDPTVSTCNNHIIRVRVYP